MRRYRIHLFLIIILCTNTSLAWNSTTHKIIAEISWQLLEPDKRHQLTQLLLHHPYYEEDLLRYMPVHFEGTEKQEKWAFSSAAVWPDLIANKTTSRRKHFHHPTWHYINLPIFIDNQELSIDVNLSTYPHKLAKPNFNIVQALQYNADQLQDRNSTPAQKAIALSWILHLVGDIHQPLHAVSLFSSRQFLDGDRGGNFISVQRVIGASNLHSVWDSLLGRAKSTRSIEQKAQQLMQKKVYAELAFQPHNWSKESHKLAARHVYTDELLTAVQTSSSRIKVHLGSVYMRQAKKTARQQSLLAGHRIAAMLNQIDIEFKQ